MTNHPPFSVEDQEVGRLGSADATPTASPVLRTEPQEGLGPDGRVPTGAAHDLYDIAAKIDAMWSRYLEPGQGPESARSGEVREIWKQLRAALAKARGEA